MLTYLPQNPKLQKEWIAYYIENCPDIKTWHDKLGTTPKFYRLMFLKLTLEREKTVAKKRNKNLKKGK